MKYLYRISLTFMVLTILSAMLLGGFYFYQSRNVKSNSQDSEQQIQETASNQDKTDCDTEYVILEQNLNSKTHETLVSEIPAKYIGKNKEQLVELLAEEERAPSLRDRQKGIQTVRLSAFSNERVVVVKTYELSEPEQTQEQGREPEAEQAKGYYLLAEDGIVCVYQEDLETLYFMTGIILDQLPDSVRQEILDKKYVKNEEELYNFLESYSS
jgi:hypothetical protein